jgi:hypothetical protein
MEERRGAYRVLVGNLRERPRRRWEILFKWLFRKWDWGALIGLKWLRIGTGGVEGTCEYGNEISRSIKCGNVLSN